ncbi:hypothetical protein [Mongoliitalea daihaiensis]|uniref:hypothetical protein n=1 Tax=Mongoliitalea daihaiensis TaxID=2782006 RepID=UPI001F28090B|nr:hypothetical protein [Mongoliitalea daihaiensis]UJP64043.1 hypothetical protein IPZ59_14615 [Mongoliitalea daihaiensis]
MKVKRLKEVLNTISSIIKTRNASIPVLESMYLTPGKVILSDLCNWILLDFPHEVEGLIDFEKFKKLVAAMDPADTVGFKQSIEKKHIYVTINGKIEVMYPREEEMTKDFPLQEETPNELFLGEIDAKTRAMLSEALLFSSNDELRPAMCGVAYGQYICGTDANMLYFEKPSNPWITGYESLIAGIKKQEPFILTKEAVKFIEKQKSNVVAYALYNKAERLSIDKKEPLIDYAAGYVKLVAEEVTFIGKWVYERYPDFLNVIPDVENTNHLEYVIDRKQFEKSVKLAIVQANQVTYRTVLEPSEDGITVSSEDLDYGWAYKKKLACKVESVHVEKQRLVINTLEDGTSVEEIKEVPPMEFYNRIGFNGKFLLKVIQRSKDAYVFIQSQAPSRGAIVDGKYLIMPIMLDNPEY